MPNSDAKLTRTQIINLAFKQIGNTNPSADESAEAVTVLNAKIKELDEDGRWLWSVSNTESTLTTVSSQRSYATGATATTITTGILELESVQLLSGSNYTPIDIISKTDSLTTYEREGTAEPYLAYLETAPLLADQKLHLFPTPNAAYTLKYTYRRRLYDFDSATDTADFPAGWDLKLVKILAAELSTLYLPLSEASGHLTLGKDSEERGRAANSEKYTPTRQVAEYF